MTDLPTMPRDLWAGRRRDPIALNHDWFTRGPGPHVRFAIRTACQGMTLAFATLVIWSGIHVG